MSLNLKFWGIFLGLLIAAMIGIVGWFSVQAYMGGDGLTFPTSCPDSDTDGLDDCEEMNIYFTEIYNPDTDGDGYLDGEEIANGYSPHAGERALLTEIDSDKDGLTDDLELKFHSSLYVADTDGDGYNDAQEIENGYDPTSAEAKKLPKSIEINIEQQKLSYLVDDVQVGEFTVSTGRNDWTPRGTFEIWYKHPRAWSKSAELWMPYWMAFDGTKYGIHELPEWPNGIKEGEEQLGVPVSGGCVRLGEGSAEYLYNWAPIGTKVTIK